MIFDNVKSIVIPEGSVKEITCNNVTLWQKIRTIIETVSGVGTIVLQNVIRLVGITQYGKCEQASTPTPSAPVDIKCNNGTLKMVDDELPTGYKRVLGFKMNNNSYWEITDFPLYGSDTLRFSFDATDACNVLGAYSGSASGNNYSLYVSTTSNYLRYKSEAYNSAINYDKRYDVELTPTGSSGMKVDSTWTAQTFTTPTNLCIGTTAKSASSAKLKGNLYGNIEIVGRAKFVPCERVNDNVLGYYDTVGESFYEQASGFSGAVSLGYDGSHYSLTVDGTPEVLTVSDISSISDFTDGYIKRSTNTVVSYVGTKDSITYTFKTSAGYVGKVFPVTVGQTYTVNYDNVTASTSSTPKIRVVELDSNISQIDDNYGADDKTYPYTFTATKPYIGIWLAYPYIVSGNVTVGVTGLTLQEVLTSQTASVENLLGVGDYKDEQNIVSGAMTRACGIKVLDGTEDWSSDGATLQIAIADCVKGTIRKVPMLCTHYPIVSNGASWNDTPTNSMYGTPGGKIGVKNTMSVADCKSFLSTQYANGTPVIILYPLAEATTESVTPQSFTVNETAIISAESDYVDDIALSGTYETPEA